MDLTLNEQSSPLLATAIHDGHIIRPEIIDYMEIDEYERLREEDPCTGYLTDVCENRLVVNTSRFEVDVNRPREGSVYRTPEQSWGLRVWKDNTPDSVWKHSYQKYDSFFSRMETIIDRLIAQWGYILVYDIHSYNYLRNGSGEKEENPVGNPDINIGTGSMDRKLWIKVVDAFADSVQGSDFQGRKLYVAENIRFKGGYLSQWVHEHFPGRSCVLSLEFKKIFMDEWTGAVDTLQIRELKRILQNTVPAVQEAACITASLHINNREV